MARMLCVLCMIYVHVPDGQTAGIVYTLTSADVFLFMEGMLVEGPGRAGAALLSVVSGFLAATTLLKPGSSALSLYRRRFVSIVVPMVFWATVTYLVYVLASQSRATFLDDLTSLMDRLNVIFFLTENVSGATMHLGFLRDLFVCILLSPLLLFAVQRIAWLLFPVLGAFYLLEHDQSSILILRPLVVFAFSIGLYLASRQVRLNALDRYWPLFTLLALLAALLILLVHSGVADAAVTAFALRGMQFDETVLYPIGRLFGSLAIWTLIPLLLGGRLQAWVQRFTPYLFAAYCSHYLMLTLVFYGVWQPLFGGRESGLFIIWFLLAPVISMAIAVLVVNVALRIAPPMASMITGGRLQVSTRHFDPLYERSQQGAVLLAWLTLTRSLDGFAGHLSAMLREWLEISWRLLYGRR
ncbi:MAG: acyltransferase family protein [Granulosicoccus sp.]|nr:acyltransferase family protein [Granulosicoccus sp.]